MDKNTTMTVQDTSAQAYYSILQTLGYKQEMVYLKLRELGNATNNELSKALGWEINQVTGGTRELVKLEIVVQHERRPCKITGMRAISWRVKRSQNA